MRLRFVILLIAALFVSQKTCKAKDADGVTTNVETRFCERGVLSPAEITNVVALAKDCGIEHSVSISTYYILPITRNWDYLIQVKGPETISGRRISYLTVDVSRRQTDAPKFKSRGEFWVKRGDVSTNNCASFTVGDHQIRVGLAPTFPLATADKIIAAFVAKRVRYPNDQASWKKTVEERDFTNPSYLEGPIEGNKYKAAAWHCEIEFLLDGDTIDIVDVSTYMI